MAATSLTFTAECLPPDVIHADEGEVDVDPCHHRVCGREQRSGWNLHDGGIVADRR